MRGPIVKLFLRLTALRRATRVHGIPLLAGSTQRSYAELRLGDALTLLQRLAPSKHQRVSTHLGCIAVLDRNGADVRYIPGIHACEFDGPVLARFSVPHLAVYLLEAGTRAYLERHSYGQDAEGRQIAVANRAAQQFMEVVRRQMPAA